MISSITSISELESGGNIFISSRKLLALDLLVILKALVGEDIMAKALFLLPLVGVFFATVAENPEPRRISLFETPFLALLDPSTF